MQEDPPDSTGDEFSVRLSWPKVVPPAPEPVPPAPAPRPRARTRAAAPAAAPAPAPASDAPVATPPPPTLRAGAALRAAAPPAPVLEVAAGAQPGVARSFVDAFDRLSDRLLDRLRVLRQDVDADLNGLRAEVAALRQAIDDADPGTQLRQVQSSLDEVRAEVAGLRRAVLEWPELERVSDEVSSMRGDLAFLFENPATGVAVLPPSAVLAELEEVVGRLSEEVGRLGAEAGSGGGGGGDADWLVDEVASIRTQLADVARRLPVAPGEDPQLLSRIAEAVTARLLDELDAGGRRSKRR